MDIERVACVGAGLIGQGWAAVFASRGCRVVLQDASEAALERALPGVSANLRFMETSGLLKKGKAEAAMNRVRATPDLSEAVGEAQYVQESVPDRYEVKRPVFEQMDAAAPEDAILASSASGLVMTEIQMVTKWPGRCVLAHPILPAHLIPVVEVVGGEQTSPETVERTTEFMKAVGKMPVVLKREVPGYIVNRLQAALLREAIDLVYSGAATVEDVDTAFCMGIGLRDPFVGPFLRIHLAGDGVEKFIENYSRSYAYRWESMATWTSIPSAAAETVIEGVYGMQKVRAMSLEAIKRWRDEGLVKVLQAVHDQEAPGRDPELA